jgi:hypothetical protein
VKKNILSSGIVDQNCHVPFKFTLSGSEVLV